MKVEVDFDNKIVKIGEKVNFKRLCKFVKQLDGWKDFSIDSNSQIIWQSYPVWQWSYQIPSIGTYYITTNEPYQGTTTTTTGYSEITCSNITNGTHQFELN